MTSPDDFQGSHGGNSDNGWREPNSEWCSCTSYVDWVWPHSRARNAYHSMMAGEPGAWPPPNNRDERYVPFWDETAKSIQWITVDVSVLRPDHAPARPEGLQSAEIGPGGSKVGAQWFPVVPPQVKGNVGEIISGAWKRTFGDKMTVKFHDLDFFPHFSGSQWFPVVPGTMSGTWNGTTGTVPLSVGGEPSVVPFRGAREPASKDQDHGNHSCGHSGGWDV
jgi:hypothetical protein